MRSFPRHPLVAICLVTLLAGCNCGTSLSGSDGGRDAGGVGGGNGGGSGGGDAADSGTGGGTGGGGGGSGGGSAGGAGGGSVVGLDGGCDPQVCYPFTSGTPGTGVCRSGLAYCVGGALGPCLGAIGPSAESCNNLDDNCDGTVDEPSALGQVSCGLGPCKVTVNACTNGKPTPCMPGAPSAEVCDGIDNDCNGGIDEIGCNCIHVAPSGLDTNPGTALSPLRTLNAGIALAASDAGLPRIVCAAAGLTCPATFDYAEAVVMRNGVSVYGGYQQTAVTDGGTWPRCATSSTRITAQNAKGVLFDSAVTSPTVLDGFDVRGANLPTNAAITVEGSTGAVINDNRIAGNGGNVSIGIDVLASAAPQLTRNTIIGGTGATQAIGVHALNAAPVIQLSCAALDANGRCTLGGCNTAGVGPLIRGRTAGNNGAQSYGVWLESSPGSIVQESAVCSSQSSGTSAGVRITGDANGTIVRTSTIDADNGAITSVALLAEPCAGAAPWVFNNFRLSGRSTISMSRADGVRAIGNCHVRVDSNRLVIGGEESANNDAIGVYCARDNDAGISSRCTVLNNTDIFGSVGGIPPSSVGVRCDDGACARIQNNRISGRQGTFAAGLFLGATGTVVDRNQISAGCAATGVGVVSRNSFARLENNVIRGTVCPGANGPVPLNSYGVQMLINTGSNEVDLNGNDIFGEGPAVSCTSRGVAFDVLANATPGGPHCFLRNNIIHGGNCPVSYALHEFNVIADPRFLENNDLVSRVDGGTLYFDENQVELVTVAEVNALLDIRSSLNLSADPLFDGGVHLAPGSPCRNAGTVTGAPRVDLDGDARPQESAPDIGADEFVP